jgi:hypothetical protein
MSLPAERLERRQRSYETYKQRILAGLSEAQRGWERETGACLVVSGTPPLLLLHDGPPKGIEEARGVSGWREYWTPEEYADMREILTPGELEEELARMQAKTEHYRAAEAMGIRDEEAAIMRLRGMMSFRAGHEEGSAP